MKKLCLDCFLKGRVEELDPIKRCCPECGCTQAAVLADPDPPRNLVSHPGTGAMGPVQ